MMKILIIEDDQTISDGMEDTLRFHDFEVFSSSSGKKGIEMFQSHHPDLIILDLMLPDIDGFEVCKKLKQLKPGVPVIMLTARSQENDKLLGFELGIDDYVTKPFSIRELVARVKAVLNRFPGVSPAKEELQKGEIITIGNADVYFKEFIVIREGFEYPLSPKEHEILKLLISCPNEVIDRNRIIDVVWGDEYYPSPRTIDNFILKLRTKIEEDPRNPVHILTVHGAGYKYKP